MVREPEAHRADALVDLALTAAGGAGGTGGAGAPVAMVAMVDYEALMRGDPVLGEKCEIPGLGPIPVALARRMATDCVLKVLVTKGVDITAVAHGGRTIPAHLRTALEARDPKCIVPHCDARRRLQIDHRDPWAATRDTSLANLARLCPWPHYQKSCLGYRYRGGPGTWEWIPPDEPVEPRAWPPPKWPASIGVRGRPPP
ncbi:MAG: HNH endonuclease signature motif containing protein [Acidimicrobiia bacterium]